MPDDNDIQTFVSETSGVTRLSKTDDETEGKHLRRVATELSGSGAERIARLRGMLTSREPDERVTAALTLGKNGSLKAIQVLRELLISSDQNAWRLAIHGLRSGGTREGWLCLEGVAEDDAAHLDSSDEARSVLAFDRLMAMGRTKMMDRLFRAADGHSRSIPGEVAKKFSAGAVATLPEDQQSVMELRLGLDDGAAATPAEAARQLGISMNDVRARELQAWRHIHSPAPFTAD